MTTQDIRAALVGERHGNLELLLRDVAEDLGFALRFADVDAGLDVVFALVTRATVVAQLASLRAASPAPVLALLSVGDERLARRALDCGARATWALDTPLVRLRDELLLVLAEAARP